MLVTVVSSPVPALTLVEAKKHLRVESGDDDALITALIAAAQGEIDGPPGWLGRAIGVQTLEASLDGFAAVDCFGAIVLPFPPVISLVSVTYVDGQGVKQTVPDAQYQFDGPAIVRPRFGLSWPAARYASGSVRVLYQAGYVAVPETIKAALNIMVADLYQNRGGTLPANVVENPTVRRLLAGFRMWSL